MEKRKKTSIILFKLWIACFAIFSCGTSIYFSYSQVVLGNDPTIFVSGYHLFAAGVILLFFIPLLYLVRYFAKTTTMGRLHKVVTIILVWLILSEGLFLLSIALAYIAPDFFTTLI